MSRLHSTKPPEGTGREDKYAFNRQTGSFQRKTEIPDAQRTLFAGLAKQKKKKKRIECRTNRAQLAEWQRTLSAAATPFVASLFTRSSPCC